MDIIEKLGISEGPWEMILTSSKEWATRNKGGILFKFWKPSKWPDQFERFERETKESFNNARLVTSAPEMLVALIKTQIYIEELVTYCGGVEEDNIKVILKACPDKTWEQIKELINE